MSAITLEFHLVALAAWSLTWPSGRSVNACDFRTCDTIDNAFLSYHFILITCIYHPIFHDHLKCVCAKHRLWASRNSKTSYISSSYSGSEFPLIWCGCSSVLKTRLTVDVGDLILYFEECCYFCELSSDLVSCVSLFEPLAGEHNRLYCVLLYVIASNTHVASHLPQLHNHLIPLPVSDTYINEYFWFSPWSDA